MRSEPLWQRYRRFWGSDPRCDFDDELAFHLAMREEELIRAGHSPDDARAETMKRFGDVEGIREECHDLGSRGAARRHTASRWDALRSDLRFALRSLRVNRGFSLAVILVMALGIGANAAVFSVAYGVLLRPLPFSDADGIVRLWSRNDERGLEFFSVSPADFRDWKTQARAFSAMGAFDRQRDAVITRGGAPEMVQVAAVTPEIFSLLGSSPAIGRAMLEEDGRPGAPAVVLLAHATWRARFGADSTVIGRDLPIDGTTHRVIGIMPERFVVPGTPAELWTPLSLTGASDDRSMRYLRVLARLAPGQDIERARTELDLIATRIAAQSPATNAGWAVSMMSVPELIVGTELRRAVLVLVGVVAFVLLIACANAANLQLARAATRRREIAVRSALGASRGRIVAQLLAESALLGMIAGVIGLAIAYGGVRLLRIVGANSVPRIEDVHLDLPVLAFTLVISLAGGILFGLLPAIQASRSDLAETLKDGARGSGSGTVGEGVRSLLVMTEVMLSLILLVGAGLLMRSFVRMQGVETGFDATDVQVIQFRMPEATYPTPADASAFYGQLLERVKPLPGLRSAALVSSAPFAGPNAGLVFARVDLAPPARGEAPDADYRVVSPEYLATIGIPLRRGRNFAPTDRETDPGVVVISETMARRYWGADEPLGSRIRLGDAVTGTAVTVIGVAADARYQTLETPDTRPMVYFSSVQRPQRSMSLVLRTSNPASALAGVRGAVAALDPRLPPPPASSLYALIGEALATRRFALVLFGIFAGVATVLAGLGIYGVMAFLVRQRTRELGIRVALGAPTGRLMASVVGRALRLTVAGALLGLLGAWYLTRALDSLLFQISATNRPTFAAVTLFVIAVGAAASFIPARRAMRADPMEALRGDG